jgi:spoIIIJ-associated protein
VQRQVETTGPTVKEAVGRALLQLGLDADDVDVDVIAEPRKGLFGNTKPAQVRVTAKASAAAATAPQPPADSTEAAAPATAAAADPAPQAAPPPAAAPATVQPSDSPEEPQVTDTDAAAPADAPTEAELSPEERLNQLDEEADLAADFVEGLLDRLDLPGDIEIEITEEQALLNLDDVGSGLLIGRRGATLDALQELVRCAVQRQTERRSRVRVDVEGYRSRHVEKLRDRCREAIAQVRETGQPVRLEPMDAYERKLMHDLVAKTGGVTSSSEGAEPKRRVVIHPDSGN